MSDPQEIQTVPKASLEKPGLIERVRRLSPWRFVLVISVIAVLAKFVIQLPILVLISFYHQPPAHVSTIREWNEMYGPLVVILLGGLVAPWIETLLGQALWMVLTPRRSRATANYVVGATVWFCSLHGIGLGLGSLEWWLSILPHGVASFLLACTFLQGWKHSWARGIWMTSTVHSVGNLSVLVPVVLLT
jgi:hypothetical protein